MGYIEYGYIGFSKAGVNHRICKNILLTKRLKIENFQFQVCVCVASTNLVSVKPLKCRVTKATQKWSKV